jgi:hypothetical protein
MDRCCRQEQEEGLDLCLDLALIHYPVVNRKKEIIGSAVTNLDLHDIARAGKTYGVRTYWVVTPYPLQQELAKTLVQHWTEGYGGTVNPDRAAALALIRISSSLEEVLSEITQRDGAKPQVIATSARPQENNLSYSEVQHLLLQRQQGLLLLFGTAWGLAPEIMDQADAVLQPIQGPGPFNHLSVRSAASIILDRLLGQGREGKGVE